MAEVYPGKAVHAEAALLAVVFVFKHRRHGARIGGNQIAERKLVARRGPKAGGASFQHSLGSRSVLDGVKPQERIQSRVIPDRKRSCEVRMRELEACRIRNMHDALEAEDSLVAWPADQYGRAAEKEGTLRSARFDPQERKDQVLADKGAMQVAVQESSCLQVEGPNGNIKRIVNGGQVVQRIISHGKSEVFVEALRPRRQP